MNFTPDQFDDWMFSLSFHWVQGRIYLLLVSIIWELHVSFKQFSSFPSPWLSSLLSNLFPATPSPPSPPAPAPPAPAPAMWSPRRHLVAPSEGSCVPRTEQSPHYHSHPTYHISIVNCDQHGHHQHFDDLEIDIPVSALTRRLTSPTLPSQPTPSN